MDRDSSQVTESSLSLGCGPAPEAGRGPAAATCQEQDFPERCPWAVFCCSGSGFGSKVAAVLAVLAVAREAPSVGL